MNRSQGTVKTSGPGRSELGQPLWGAKVPTDRLHPSSTPLSSSLTPQEQTPRAKSRLSGSQITILILTVLIMVISFLAFLYRPSFLEKPAARQVRAQATAILNAVAQGDVSYLTSHSASPVEYVNADLIRATARTSEIRHTILLAAKNDRAYQVKVRLTIKNRSKTISLRFVKTNGWRLEPSSLFVKITTQASPVTLNDVHLREHSHHVVIPGYFQLAPLNSSLRHAESELVKFPGDAPITLPDKIYLDSKGKEKLYSEIHETFRQCSGQRASEVSCPWRPLFRKYLVPEPDAVYTLKKLPELPSELNFYLKDDAWASSIVLHYSISVTGTVRNPMTHERQEVKDLNGKVTNRIEIAVANDEVTWRFT